MLVLKKKMKELLALDDFSPADAAALSDVSSIKVVNALIPLLVHSDPIIKWRSITLFGLAVRRLELEQPDMALETMRKLVWIMSEESGNIGWGVPEAMAEAMVHSSSLAGTFSSILVSFLYEEGNFLEFEPLQAGALWGAARLAQVRPDLMVKNDTGQYLLEQLESDVSGFRGLAAWGTGFVKHRPAVPALERLRGDPAPLLLYCGQRFKQTTVGELAREALDAFMRAA